MRVLPLIYGNMVSQVLDHADSLFAAEGPSLKPLPVGEEIREKLASYTVDFEAGAVYFRLGAGRIRKTLEASAKVLVDVDDSGKVVGIEILVSDPQALKALESFIQSRRL